MFLQLPKLLLPVEGDAADFQCVSAGRELLLGRVQVAEPIPLVDAEDAVVIPLGDDVADMVVEGLNGGHQFEDVLLGAKARKVELHVDRAVHGDAI